MTKCDSDDRDDGDQRDQRDGSDISADSDFSSVSVVSRSPRSPQNHKITKSQNHKITGGGGGVISVIKCDKCDEKITTNGRTDKTTNTNKLPKCSSLPRPLVCLSACESDERDERDSHPNVHSERSVGISKWHEIATSDECPPRNDVIGITTSDDVLLAMTEEYSTDALQKRDALRVSLFQNIGK